MYRLSSSIIILLFAGGMRSYMIRTQQSSLTTIFNSFLIRPLSASPKNVDEDVNKLSGPAIQWYPGHIAKAERELAEYLKKVDVVIEVRDARIPLATTHPMVPSWVGNKPLIVAIARLDQISSKALQEWREYYAINPAHPQRPDAKVYFVDGKMGSGILTLKKQALKAGVSINERRVRRGIQPRAVRAAVIGFPNVGKSALINRLLGRKMAKSRNLPGVTRQLMWVRLGGVEGSQQENTIELLDSPGIIPAQQINQLNALKLAICNDIGEASYDRVVVAAHMCDLINSLAAERKYYVNMNKIVARYTVPFQKLTGEEIVYRIAESLYNGNLISAADKLLGDFRKGFMGPGSLEYAPGISQSNGPSSRLIARVSARTRSDKLSSGSASRGSTTSDDFGDGNDGGEDNNGEDIYDDNDDDVDSELDMQKVMEKQLRTKARSDAAVANRLSASVDPTDEGSDRKSTKVNLDVGKGNYEGW